MRYCSLREPGWDKYKFNPFLLLSVLLISIILSHSLANSLYFLPIMGALFLLFLFFVSIDSFYGVLCLAFLFPIQRSAFGDFGNQLFGTILIFSLIILLILKGLKRESFSNLSDSKIKFAVLFAFLLLSFNFLSLFIRAMFFEKGTLFGSGGLIYFYMSLFGFLFYFLLTFSIDSKDKLLRVLKVFLFGGGAIAFLGFFDVITGKNVFPSLFGFITGSGRATSIYFDPNLLAVFLVTYLFVMLGVFSQSKSINNKFLLLLLMGLSFYILVQTFSLSGFIAFTLSFIVYLFIVNKNKFRFILTLGCFLVAAFVFVHLSLDFVPNETKAKAQALLFNPATSSSILSRIYLDRAGIQFFAENPIFGIGYGKFEDRFINSLFYLRSPSHIPVSHNSYILALSETGLVGFSLLIALIFLQVYFAYRVINTGSGDFKLLQIGFFCALVANLIFSYFYATLLFNMNFWFLLGLINVTYILNLRNK